MSRNNYENKKISYGKLSEILESIGKLPEDFDYQGECEEAESTLKGEILTEDKNESQEVQTNKKEAN